MIYSISYCFILLYKVFLSIFSNLAAFAFIVVHLDQRLDDHISFCLSGNRPKIILPVQSGLCRELMPILSWIISGGKAVLPTRSPVDNKAERLITLRISRRLPARNMVKKISITSERNLPVAYSVPGWPVAENAHKTWVYLPVVHAR